MKKILGNLKNAFSLFAQGFKQASVEHIERELSEMENGFCLIIMSSLTGICAPPPFIGLSLLPYLEPELEIMLKKSKNLDDKLAQWSDLVDL